MEREQQKQELNRIKNIYLSKPGIREKYNIHKKAFQSQPSHKQKGQANISAGVRLATEVSQKEHIVNDESIFNWINGKLSEQAQNNLLAENNISFDDLNEIYQLPKGVSFVEWLETRWFCQDLDLGDAVMAFPNPDHPNAKDKPISLKEALKIFDNQIIFLSEESNQGYKNTQHRNAFIKAFFALSPYYVQQSNKIINKNKNIMHQFAEFQEKNSLQEDYESGELLFEEEGIHAVLQLEETYNENYVKQKALQKEKGKMNQNQNKSKAELINMLSTQNKQFLTKLNQLRPECIERLSKYIIRKYSQGGALQQRHVLGKKVWFQTLNPLDFLTSNNINSDIQEQIHSKREPESHIQREPDSHIKIKADTDSIFNKCHHRPTDFTTLLRHIILSFICGQGLIKFRITLSKRGEEIFAVFRAQDAVICKLAEETKLMKQVELGAVDLLSLEPVDNELRPLRLKNYIKRQDLRNEEAQEKVKQLQIFELRDDKQQNDDNLYGIQFFANVKELDSDSLQWMLIHRTQNVEEHLKKVQKELQITFNLQQDKNIGLLEDKPLSYIEWQTYLLYLDILGYELKKFHTHLKNNEKIKKSKFFIYKLIYMKALTEANRVSMQFKRNNESTFLSHFSQRIQQIFQPNKILFNLWDRLQTEPKPPYVNFELKNERQLQWWRSYEQNELMARAPFLPMERSRLVNIHVMKSINLYKLIDQHQILALFPIHDRYQLYADSKLPLFSQLTKMGIIQTFEPSLAQAELNQLYKNLSKFAESTDFDSDGSCLAKEIAFNWMRPCHIDIASIRNYFGEKIALYFKFVSYYAFALIPMGAIGLAAQILIYMDIDEEKQKMVNFIFTIINVCWAAIFLEGWKRRENIFGLQFGQSEKQSLNDIERPGFEGVFQRDVSSFRMNEEYYPSIKRKMKEILSIIITLLVISLSIGCVILTFLLQQYWRKNQSLPSFLVDILPSIFNSGQILFFNFVYEKIAYKMNNFENHKNVSAYENALILKIFSFLFMNAFNSFFIISFLGIFVADSMGVCTVSQNGLAVIDCFKVLAIRVETIFIVMFVKNIPELVVPLVQNWLKQRHAKIAQVQTHHMQKQNMNSTNYNYGATNDHFHLIDQEIEKQFLQAEYAQSIEIDGTFDDYLELVFQFAFLTLFSPSFPLAYPMALLNNIAEIQVDKYKVMHCTKRPFAKPAHTIGVWRFILDWIVYLAIITNAGLIVFTIKDKANPQASFWYITPGSLVSFVALCFILIVIKLVIQYLIEDVPQVFTKVSARHKYVYKNLFSSNEKQRTAIKGNKLNPEYFDPTPSNVRVVYQNKNINLNNSNVIKKSKPQLQQADQNQDANINQTQILKMPSSNIKQKQS